MKWKAPSRPIPGDVPLFDLEAGEAAAVEGMDRVLNAANAGNWKAHALDALADLAATGRPFTADDLVTRAGLPPGDGHKAVGAVINAAAKRRLILKTGQYRKSRRAATHGRVIAEWVGR